MLRLGRLLVSLLVVLAVAVAAACSNDATGPSPIEAESALVLNHRLAYCTPQPLGVVSEVIGPDGGTLRAGRHKLTFPVGALKEPTLITMTTPRDTLSQVVFEPEGLTFPIGREPELTMSYRECRLPLVALKEIVYTDDNYQVREHLLTLDNPLAGLLSARLRHFSRYAVMY